ncbi:protein-associating with the carboxyl-terminal domain of ezrin isoform X2 [Athalia rosae]|nr:protein-associating with the carboxyl-terminal domain of ezrin isoform X2 [Athalia rosae]
MLHRHPCILKYVSSWHKGSKFFLATEEVKPLVQVIGMQTTLQICIGLHSILRALIFLHEKALASHNNVCSSAIYVTPDGFWKLGGLEYLCRFTELTPVYLQKTRNYRYEKAISPEEDGGKSAVLMEPSAIDQFAFGVLAEEVLSLKSDDDVPSISDFKELAKKHLQNADPSLRTKLSSVLVHPFFTHEFITIHGFLMELPLKNEAEKQDFFSNLVVQLNKFPEKIVAEQLGGLLLSRMVLLDSTAQSKLLPFILTPRDENSESDLLFTLSTFKKYVVPKLLQMFCVRDAQIRLLLLSHFNSFVGAFQPDDLKLHVLPELLVAIKDTNDHLVSTTLRALADLVPLLGSATVIGGSRGKLFTDGRPNKAHRLKESQVAPVLTKDKNSVPDVVLHVQTSVLELPERPSPDGGEDQIDLDPILPEEEGNWSDWDAQDSAQPGTKSPELRLPNDVQESIERVIPDAGALHSEGSSNTLKDETSKYSKKPIISDILELDIKNSKPMRMSKEEIDFFEDMEPVIKKTQILHIQEATTTRSMFDVKAANASVDEAAEDNGWGDDLNDWGADETSHARE